MDEIELDPIPRPSNATPALTPSTSKNNLILTPAPTLPLPPDYIPALPPVDTGKQAYLFLLGATLVETLVWGLPYSVGILHAYWTNHLFKDYEGGESTLTLAATLQTGLLYMSSAAVAPLFTAYPRYMKRIQYFGLVVSSASIIGSAFATKPWHLILSIGCFYPFAGATYTPCATLIFEWFSARRGLASGIMYAGTGAGGATFPFIVSALLNRFGYKAAMISLGVGFGVLGGLALIGIQRRVPLSRGEMGGRRKRRGGGVGGGGGGGLVDWKVLRSWLFGWGCVLILLHGMGNFVPSVWIPSYAADLKLTKPDGIGLISIMNAASVPGVTLTGYLSDRLPLKMVILVSCLFATLSCLLLWGLGTTDQLLILFSLAWGLSGLSFVGLWSKVISVICGDDPIAPPLVFSVFAALKGVGNITSGPISDALLSKQVFRGAAGAYGFKNYGLLLVYTGSATFVAGMAGWVF